MIVVVATHNPEIENPTRGPAPSITAPTAKLVIGSVPVIAIPHRLMIRPRKPGSQRSWASVLASAMNQIELMPTSTIPSNATAATGAHDTTSTDAAVQSASIRTLRPVGSGAAAASSAPGKPPSPNAAIIAP